MAKSKEHANDTMRSVSLDHALAAKDQVRVYVNVVLLNSLPGGAGKPRNPTNTPPLEREAKEEGFKRQPFS